MLIKDVSEVRSTEAFKNKAEQYWNDVAPTIDGNYFC